MTDDSFRKWLNCIATSVSRINGLASLIDSRLFIFSYFSPKVALKNSSNEAKFYLVILNLYGLFVDCNKGNLENILFGKFANGDFLIPAEFKPIRDQVINFLDSIKTLRAYYCHNNSQALYFQKENNEFLQRYLSALFDDRDTIISEKIYKKALELIMENSVSILDQIAVFLEFLSKIDDSKKTEVADLWKVSIRKWINDEMFMHVIREVYEVRCHEIGKMAKSSPNKYTATKKMLERNGIAYPFDSWRDEVAKLFDSSNCPKPALPLASIYEVVVSNFPKDLIL